MPDAVQPSRGRGKPGEQSNHAARVLFQPRIQLPGRGDLGPLIVGRKSQRFGETQVGLSPVSGMSARSEVVGHAAPEGVDLWIISVRN
jgi:hypothetical protein